MKGDDAEAGEELRQPAGRKFKRLATVIARWRATKPIHKFMLVLPFSGVPAFLLPKMAERGKICQYLQVQESLSSLP